MAANVATFNARAYSILKGSPDAQRSAEYIAGITGMEVDQARSACGRLVKAKKAAMVGISQSGSPLYQYVEGAEKPVDGRGKQHKRLTGRQWAVRRKQRANLVKANRARKLRATANGSALVLGVRLGVKHG